MTLAYSKTGCDDLAILFTAGAIGTLSDAELLARFARGRGDLSAEAAFAVLVDRHGPMVLGVCRRITGDWHAADDAFQAVFLILARKAHAVRLGADDSLGRWLYGVSLRVARRARAATTRQPIAARDLDGFDPIDPSSSFDPCEQADLRAAIDDEIARLPARYRSAVVLCHLEGLSQKQAARRLRCPVGTVESRLHRARERLRSGLARRGLAPGGRGLVAVLDQPSRAAVESDLAKATAAAAARISAGEALAEAVPAAVAALAAIHLRTMIMRQCWMIAGLIALGITMTVGAARAGDRWRRAAGRTLGQTNRSSPPNARLKAKPSLPSPRWPRSSIASRPSTRPPTGRSMQLYRGSTIPEENRAKAAEIQPDFPAVVRRIADLARELTEESGRPRRHALGDPADRRPR